MINICLKKTISIICIIGVILSVSVFTFSVFANESQEILEFNPKQYNGEITHGQIVLTTFEIWNDGNGKMSYTFYSSENWISISPKHGTSKGEHDIISITIDSTNLIPGVYREEIFIYSSGGNESFLINISINEQQTPILEFSPKTFYAEIEQRELIITNFEIWNAGIDTLNYDLIPLNSWLSTSPASGSSNGEHDIINLIIDSTDLEPGYHLGELLIFTPYGNESFNVEVSIKEELCPILKFSPTSHDFGEINQGETAFTTFQIWNEGNGSLIYNIYHLESWIEVNPIQGTSNGEKDAISVTVNTNNLEEGSYNGNIFLRTNGGNDTFFVKLTVNDSELTDDPEDPPDPKDPEEPEDPEEPRDPEDPEDPPDPKDPEEPEDPDTPEDPRGTTDPADLTQPDNPDNIVVLQRIEPEEPAQQLEKPQEIEPTVKPEEEPVEVQKIEPQEIDSKEITKVEEQKVEQQQVETQIPLKSEGIEQVERLR